MFRDGVRLELADILADEVTRAERHHRPDATPERRDASPAPSTVPMVSSLATGSPV